MYNFCLSHTITQKNSTVNKFNEKVCSAFIDFLLIKSQYGFVYTLKDVSSGFD